jgi:hypothetical protein
MAISRAQLLKELLPRTERIVWYGVRSLRRRAQRNL